MPTLAPAPTSPSDTRLSATAPEDSHPARRNPEGAKPPGGVGEPGGFGRRLDRAGQRTKFDTNAGVSDPAPPRLQPADDTTPHPRPREDPDARTDTTPDCAGVCTTPARPAAAIHTAVSRPDTGIEFLRRSPRSSVGPPISQGVPASSTAADSPRVHADPPSSRPPSRACSRSKRRPRTWLSHAG